MLKITPNQSAQNLSSDMAEDAKADSGTSSTTKSGENLSASVEMTEDAKFGKGDGDDDKTVKRSTLSMKPNGRMGYLTSLQFDADSASFEKR